MILYKVSNFVIVTPQSGILFSHFPMMNMMVIFCCSMKMFTFSLTGSILIDGLDIRDIQIESLRRNIGLVSQDTVCPSLLPS